jgi:3-phosphoshikimate 1-carboxyvinyltransferase
MIEGMTQNNCWSAPEASEALHSQVCIPGSKSLSNRYLMLAALGKEEVHIRGLLRSRDTDLMIKALEQFGVECHADLDDPTHIRIQPPERGFVGDGREIYCGLAGTVMRFVPALAMLASGPTRFYGDKQAQSRPMKPLLDALASLGAKISYEGAEGFLPFTIEPTCEFTGGEVDIDASLSSQFISGLLLLGSRAVNGLRIRHTGRQLPSLSHIRMTMADLREAGIGVSEAENSDEWMVMMQPEVSHYYPHLAKDIQVEPDLSNAAPFLEAPLIVGGKVSVPFWPSVTTQPGGLLPDLLEAMGGRVELPVGDQHSCQVEGNGRIHALGDYDLSTAGELAPSIAAISVFADGPTRLHGIGHLRGHETNRLQALTEQIRNVGGEAEELKDGIEIIPVSRKHLHPAVIETYHDHRMATFGALLGLGIPGIRVVNIETTRKTLPNFVDLWKHMLHC